MGGMGGMPGGMPGGMGGGMPGMDGDGPFSAAKLEALKTNPKIAEFMKDVKFKNLYDLCIQNPQMLIQFIQMDPRFQVVFQEMTGINLGDVQAQQAKREAEEEKTRQAQAEAQAKRDAEEAAKRKAAEEAAIPDEAKQELQRARDAEAKKLEGNGFYKKKDFKQALECYNAAIELNPNELLFYTNVAACHIEQKNFDLAISACEEAEKRAKGKYYDYVKLAKVLARKASAYEKSGQFEIALDTYSKALLENNDESIKLSMKNIEKKKRELEAKAYINPDIAEEHKRIAGELFKEKKFPEAIKEYDEGIRRDPTNKTLFTNRSMCYIKLAEPNYGLKDANKALELDPKFVKAWIRKAMCHQMLKEYHKAIDAYEKGLQIEPDNKDCLEGRAKVYNMIQASSHASSGNDEERFRHAMADPEI